jgi:hypothetical protein
MASNFIVVIYAAGFQSGLLRRKIAAFSVTSSHPPAVSSKLSKFPVSSS